MPRLFQNNRFVLTFVGIVLVAAVILGITKYKIPAKHLNVLNTNSTNVNRSTMAYPFAQITTDQVTNKQVHITTAKGDIVFKLDPVAGPLAAKNFVYLASKGFYDGVTFWRVEDNFVIQGGDPSGTGRGGPGYSFADDPVTQSYVDGTVAMANSGPDTNGSQFFICKGELCKGLGPSYSIFGQVTSGMDVVKQIVPGDVMTKVTIEPAS